MPFYIIFLGMPQREGGNLLPKKRVYPHRDPRPTPGMTRLLSPVFSLLFKQ